MEYKGTVLFYTTDGFGHINPSMQIGSELRKRGYRVILLTILKTPFSKQILEAGLELHHCKDNPVVSLKEIQEKLTSIMMTPSPRDSFRNMFKVDNLGLPLFERYFENEMLIKSKIESFKPDLLVFDVIYGLPCFTEIVPRWVRIFSGFPSELFRCHNENFVAGMGLRLDEMTPEMKQEELSITRDIRDLLRRYYESRDAPPLPYDLDFAPTSPDLNFYLGPEELGLEKVERLKPLPSCWHRLEHVIPATAGEGEGDNKFELPEHLAKLPGKLVYFSLGSACVRNKPGAERQNRLLEMMSRSPHRFIVSMGPMHEMVRLHPNMWGQEFVNQKAVLPEVDLYITHGGHNSTMEAFYYGVPAQIVMPLGADQFDCAQRIEDCGFGKRLNFFECTEAELLGTIESLLSNHQLKARMQRVSKRLQSIDYIKIAADKLVAYMGKKG